MIPDEIIRDVLDAVDIVDLIGRTVELRKAGTIYKGLCPFHDEKTPSFTVTPERRTYHCFGCGEHGNAIGFLMEHERLNFPEAVRTLAQTVGIEVPEPRPQTPQQRKEREEKKSEARRLLDAQDALCGYYTDQLFGPSGMAARRYLMGRGVSEAAARAFRLGWASGDKARFEAWMRQAKIDREDLVKLGVLLKPEEGWGGEVLGGGYLRFRSRLMFPVVEIGGGVVGFSGRLVEDRKKAAKYVNSPETPIFTKGEHLYGAYTARKAARRAGRLIFCEGNLDVVALWQSGFEGSVAAMGTALTQRQVRLAKRLCEEVLCVMDGDEAGRKALFESLGPFLDEGIHPRALLLPEGDDPDSYLKRNGPAALNQAIAGAPPLFDLLLDKVAEESPDDPLGRVEALKQLLPHFKRLDDPLTQALYKQKICERLGVPEQTFDLALSGQAPALPREAYQRPFTGDSAPPPMQAPSGNFPPQPVPPGVIQIIGIILQLPEIILQAPKQFWRENLTHEGLIRFLADLYSEVEQGCLVDITHHLNMLGMSDRSLSDRLWDLRVNSPSQTEETIKEAFEQSLRVLERQSRQRRYRLQLQQSLLARGTQAFKSTNLDGRQAGSAEFQAIKNTLNPSK